MTEFQTQVGNARGAMTTNDVKTAIEAALDGAKVTVSDMTGTSDHFDVEVVWPGFAGVGLVQQHQTVYQALGDALRGPVHALKLRTRAKE